MSEEKLKRLERARTSLKKNGINYVEFNNGYHFKIGALDFWPTTGKWSDGFSEGIGLDTLIKHLKPRVSKSMKVLTVDQIFDVAKQVKIPNLYNVCEAIHKEIYGT